MGNYPSIPPEQWARGQAVDRAKLIPPYSRLMEGDGAHIRLRLSTREPIALTDFVANFVGIGNQFEKFVAREYPDLKADSEIFVKEVRAGSIEADLVAWVLAPGVLGVALAAVEVLEKAQVLAKFVANLNQRIRKYFTPGGRDGTASKGDLADFLRTVQAVAHDTNGTAQIEAAVFDDGERKVRAGFKFTTAEAREAEREISQHKLELEASTDADHKRVLLRFVRPSIEPTKTHARTGERALIEAVHPKPLAIVYASDLARERIAHELKEAESNIFRLLFDVDVNVELSQGRPVAFRIVAVHDVTDAPDD